MLQHSTAGGEPLHPLTTWIMSQTKELTTLELQDVSGATAKASLLLTSRPFSLVTPSALASCSTSRGPTSMSSCPCPAPDPRTS